MEQTCRVAVLIATYNGEQFVEPQIRSLRANSIYFTLHWIDDHSTDATRGSVRGAAQKARIKLHEWHHPTKLGYPGVFLFLLERVDADIYLFCDQDDLWQPGKIDASVANLTRDLDFPALCFSEPLMFNDDEPQIHRPLFDILHLNTSRLVNAPGTFTFVPAVGNTIAITRPVRETFLSTAEVAWRYAFAHDWWVYMIALATGSVELLARSPTTLWRQHKENYSSTFFKRRRRGIGHFPMRWEQQPLLRRLYATQALGFLEVSTRLPQTSILEEMQKAATLVSTLEKRKSVGDLYRLLRCRALPPRLGPRLKLATSCFLSEIAPSSKATSYRK